MKHKKKKSRAQKPSAWYALPFFAAMAVLTVVAFIIPLRPTQSLSEKRNLAQFPEFTPQALISGSYFDDINTWFSDTFPGRESWLEVSAAVSELHGWSDVVIHGDIQAGDPVPTVPAPGETTTEPAETEPAETVTEATLPPETTEAADFPMETIPPPTIPIEQWGGVDAGEDAEVYLNSVIQVGDSAFIYFSFSDYYSSRYAKAVNKFADAVQESGVNIISAVPPTAVGVMVENEFMAKLKCSPQDQVIDYINGSLNENVIGLDTYALLVNHNSEYIYFRTDHHWSALGAYYVYRGVCASVGMDPAALDSFEVLDQGEFKGSLYYKCNQSSRLTLDNVLAYKPAGEITTMIYNENGYGFAYDAVSDMSKSDLGSKYMGFLAGDHPLVVITNDSIPDAPNCVLLKDSFGNCFAPFLSQNYHNVYVVDYRMYRAMGMTAFVEEFDIRDVIILPNLSAVQSENVIKLLEYVLR